MLLKSEREKRKTPHRVGVRVEYLVLSCPMAYAEEWDIPVVGKSIQPIDSHEKEEWQG
jgi:hypothetical protein